MIRKYANDYGMGKAGGVQVRAGALIQMVLGVAMLAAGFSAPAITQEKQPRETAITCTNPASGASFEVRIDYDRSTADSYPAQISETQVSWRDRSDGGKYTLDRKSGELTVIVASSTGGYFLHHRCKLEN
jgi:hypothetical protein